MGTSKITCYRTELGKILSKLRVEYAETQSAQAERLGYTSNYISLVSTGRRCFTVELYNSVMEHYGRQAEIYKNELLNILFKDDIKTRFYDYVPNGSIEDLLYLVYGIR